MGQYFIDDRNIGLMLMTDSARALAELAKLPPGSLAAEAYRGSFRIWAGMNPKFSPQAAAQAFALPPGVNRTQALEGVAIGWANRDPQGDLAWAGNLPPEDVSALAEAVKITGKTQPMLAAPFVDKLTDATSRNAAIGVIAQSMAQNDPAGTLSWLDQVATGATYDNAVQNLFANLAGRDPAQAVGLMDKLPEDTTQLVDTNTLFATWIKQDSKAFLDWLAVQPVGDRRDAAIGQLVNSGQTVMTPAGIISLVGTINSPQTKAKLLQKLSQSNVTQN
jgi:hypothetical protein